MAPINGGGKKPSNVTARRRTQGQRTAAPRRPGPVTQNKTAGSQFAGIGGRTAEPLSWGAKAGQFFSRLNPFARTATSTDSPLAPTVRPQTLFDGAQAMLLSPTRFDGAPVAADHITFGGRNKAAIVELDYLREGDRPVEMRLVATNKSLVDGHIIEIDHREAGQLDLIFQWDPASRSLEVRSGPQGRQYVTITTQGEGYLMPGQDVSGSTALHIAPEATQIDIATQEYDAQRIMRIFVAPGAVAPRNPLAQPQAASQPAPQMLHETAGLPPAPDRLRIEVANQMQLARQGLDVRVAPHGDGQQIIVEPDLHHPHMRGKLTVTVPADITDSEAMDVLDDVAARIDPFRQAGSESTLDVRVHFVSLQEFRVHPMARGAMSGGVIEFRNGRGGTTNYRHAGIIGRLAASDVMPGSTSLANVIITVPFDRDRGSRKKRLNDVSRETLRQLPDAVVGVFTADSSFGGNPRR